MPPNPDDRGASFEPRRYSVLLISSSYPPVLGGSEIEAQRICSALLRRGHKATVVCAGGPPMPNVSRWVDPAGVPVRIFAGRRLARLKDHLFALAVAYTLFRERRNYDVVYFLMQGLHLAAGLPMARLLGKPVVMKVSGSGIFTLMRRSWLGRMELRLLAKWARRVMILNDGMAEEAASCGLPSGKLLWMPNPVDIDEFAPCAAGRRAELRGELRIPEPARVVLFVGRLAPEKELPSLVRGFAEAVREAPEAVLTLVGDGPMRKELEALVASLGLEDKVRFAGRLSVPEVVRWLQAADVFALVSSLEGFPCSLVEAMSAGLPAVVSDIPANAQLVEPDVHGLRVPVCDASSIGAALARLLNDDRLRAQMGAEARCATAARYSTDRIIARYEDLFAEAVR